MKHVHVDISGSGLSAATKSRLRKAVYAALAVVPKSDKQHRVLHSRSWNVSIALISPAKIRKLNQQYRNKDKATDVLSFPLWQTAWVLAEDPAPSLGDILICPQVARAQCKEWGNTYLQELVRLTIHGTLHLLDYDHERTAAEATKMRTLESKALKKCQSTFGNKR